MARGFFRTKDRVGAFLVVDDGRKARQAQRFGDRTTAHPRTQDGGGAGQTTTEAVRDFGHPIFNVSRPSRPQRKERIQKRATTLVAGQPFFWK